MLIFQGQSRKVFNYKKRYFLQMQSKFTYIFKKYRKGLWYFILLFGDEKNKENIENRETEIQN